MSTRVALGFDVGGTTIKAGVVAWDGIDASIVATCQHPTETLCSPDGLIAWISQQCERWQSEYPAVEAVGIGFPACIEWDSGIVAHPPNIPWWPNQPFPLRTELSKRLSLPVMLDNDANVAAHAECLLGYGGNGRGFCLSRSALVLAVRSLPMGASSVVNVVLLVSSVT